MEIDKRLLVKISQLEQYIQKFESLVPQNEEEYNLSEVIDMPQKDYCKLLSNAHWISVPY